MARLVHRPTQLAASSGGVWQDVTVGYSGMSSQFATDGRKVRMSLSGSDWGAQVDAVNGASVTARPGGAFDGSDAVRIVPPSGATSNPNNTYSAIMRNLDLTNSGTKDVSRVNLGFCVYYGSRYFDLGHQSKVTGILPSQTMASSAATLAATRAAIYEAFVNPPGDLRRAFSAITGGIAEYFQPPQGGFANEHPAADLPVLVGNVSNHANDPPLVGQEWIYMEQRVDFRRTGANPNGRIRLDIWARDGLLGFLSVPLTNRPDWDFSYQYGHLIEYIGALWNQPGTADANNYLDVSHPIVAVNMPWNDTIGSGVIGPPTGSINFLQ